MLQHKGFIYVGKFPSINKDRLIVFLGVIGALISVFGAAFDPAQIYYVIGSSLLFTTAVYFQLLYFVALEIILMCGHGANWLELGQYLQIALPVLLCLQLLIFYALSGQIQNLFILIGITGIAVLSVGFSYHNQWIFFIGSLAIAVYAFYHSTKQQIALIWALLNSVFALLSLIKIFHPM